jgi:hypothetical protein
MVLMVAAWKLRHTALPGDTMASDVQRISHHCVLTQDALNHFQQPIVIVGQRVSALRFGDPRVMALLQAIIGFTHLPRGFRNRDLRPRWKPSGVVRIPPHR